MHTEIHVSKTFRMAREFGISSQAAARMRIRYLSDHVDAYLSMNHETTDLWAIEALEEIIQLIDKGFWAPIRKTPDSVDDLRIQQARDFPITELINFKNEKAEAWCHNDRKPSLYYADRTNKAICPVCDKKFNPIDVLMKRDGYTFIEAVKSLTP